MIDRLLQELDEPTDISQLGQFRARHLHLQLAHRYRYDLDDVEAVGAEILHRFRRVDLGFIEPVHGIEQMLLHDRVNLILGHR